MKFSLFKREKALPDPALVSRGRAAIDLLKSTTFHTAMEELEKDIWKQFMATPANAPADREILYTHLTALGLVKLKLETYAEQGKLAERQLRIKEGGK